MMWTLEEMDINWQIAMIAIRMKKFYKKTGRRVRIDGNKPVGFDKRALNVDYVGKAFCIVDFSKNDNFQRRVHSLTGDYTPKNTRRNDDSSVCLWPNVNTGRANVNSIKSNVNSVRPNVNTGRANITFCQVNYVYQRSHFSKSLSPVRRPIDRNTARMSYSHAVKGNWGTTVKTSAGPQGRPKPEKAWVPKRNLFIFFMCRIIYSRTWRTEGIFDTWLLRAHDLVTKDTPWMIFEVYKGGSVTFGGSKGYITGKGRIRVGNLDFDSVSFVKELGHFNLFSISQICDKKHKVLFTKTECLVVSPDFQMADENQTLLKVPRQHNMDIFDSGNKGIKQEYSNARTPQQNRVAERMNRTLIKAARTMLADSLLPTTFWAEAVSTACYIFNREEDEAEELIVVPTALKHTATTVGPRKSSTNSKEEEFLTELQNLKA
ncbi:ribonuclease H-like domain-containing protein [Tanacetum coccineum]|uniref:Ribonuclease H-like domain-containing protein n=1 Tax=Tanacetum coccineum TaxID=301880 RepID=A0ABQ4WV35_9ASTR